MRILVKRYFNELQGYLIMSFTSIPVMTNDKNEPECIFSNIDMLFDVETETKRKQTNSIFKTYDFNKIYVGDVYNRP